MLLNGTLNITLLTRRFNFAYWKIQYCCLEDVMSLTGKHNIADWKISLSDIATSLTEMNNIANWNE